MTFLPPRGGRIFYFGVLFILAGVIIALAMPLLPMGGFFGSRDARRDILEGQIAVKFTFWERGPHAEKEQRFRDALRESYGIHLDRRAPGCMKPEFGRTYDRAYNEVMNGEIMRRYGRDVVRELAEQIMGDRAF